MMSLPRKILSGISNRLTPLLHGNLKTAIRTQTALTPMGEFAESDIFIAGYPKSGNTWVQNLLAGIVYGVDSEALPDALVQDLVPDVHFRRYYRRYGTPMHFKTHDLPKREYRRVIYLLRDGRDVMVSYFHHLKALEQNGANLADMVRTGRNLYPCKWHEHVTAWQSNPFAAEIMVLKYEDLLEESLVQLRRVCDFIRVSRPEPFLIAVAEKNSFGKMRQKEQQQGWEHPTWPKDKFFVRRGMAGSYKDEMPEDVIQLFVADAAEALRAYNYLP